MENKYRIVEVRKGKDVKYRIQIKRWWIPFWYTKDVTGLFIGEYHSLDVAKSKLEYLKSPTVKKIITED